MARRQETAPSAGGFVADTAKSAGAPTYAPTPGGSRKMRSPERAAAVLDRASRMAAFKPSILDRNPFDRQMRTPSPVQTSRLGNLNTLPHDALHYRGVETVPMSALKSDQKTVSVAAVKGKIADAAKGTPATARELPLVLKDGNTYRVMDGNHRLTAQRLLGSQSANVRVVAIKGTVDAVQQSTVAAGQAADAARLAATAQNSRVVRKEMMGAAKATPAQPVAGDLGKTAPTRGPNGRFVAAAKSAPKVAVAADPLVMAGMGAAAASSAYMTAREQGASRMQAAGAGAVAAAPMAAGAALPTLLGRAAPVAASALAKVALPLTAAAAGVAAVREGVKAYNQGKSAGQVAGAAAMGAADNLTFGFASRGLNWLTGSASGGGADPVTHRIAAAAGQSPTSGPMQDAMRKFSIEKRGGAKEDAAREQPSGRSTSFDRANQAYEVRKAGGQAEPAKDAGPGAPWGGKRKGWSNAARIAAAKARGIEKLPYGGDPNAGPSEWAPGGQSA